MRRYWSFVLTVLVVMLLLPGAAVAKNAKVDVCHLTGNGSFILIDVSEKALPDHLAHGDGLPGWDVPGMPGHIFDEACQPTLEPTLEIAAFGGVEPLQAEFDAAGLNVVVTHTDEMDLSARIDVGTPPDILVVPHPGLALTFAAEGHLLPTTEFVAAQQLYAAFGSYLLDVVALAGEPYGLPVSVNLKSLLWYPPREFEDNGYVAPQTWDELTDLSDAIVGAGSTPWCMAMYSGDTTGWMGTDWIEEILLRTAGPEVYDQWVRHEIPFTHPAVRLAFHTYADVLFPEDYTLETSDYGTLTTGFWAAATPMLTDPPECWLHKQGSVLRSFLNPDVILGEDIAPIPFPSIDVAPLAAIGGGEHAVVFSKNRTGSENRLLDEVVEFMASPYFGSNSLADSGWIGPHLEFDAANYADDFIRQAAEVIRASLIAGEFRFDASDMMPFEVGGPAFWNGIVRLIEEGDGATPQELDTLIGSIVGDLEDLWP